MNAKDRAVKESLSKDSSKAKRSLPELLVGSQAPAPESVGAILARAIASLASLDLSALEDLVDGCARAERPRSSAEWKQAIGQHWMLGHLVEESGRRLAMLRRVSANPERFESYRSRKEAGLDLGRAFSPPPLFGSRDHGKTDVPGGSTNGLADD